MPEESTCVVLTGIGGVDDSDDEDDAEADHTDFAGTLAELVVDRGFRGQGQRFAKSFGIRCCSHLRISSFVARSGLAASGIPARNVGRIYGRSVTDCEPGAKAFSPRRHGEKLRREESKGERQVLRFAQDDNMRVCFRLFVR